jgi:hypothetical protein
MFGLLFLLGCDAGRHPDRLWCVCELADQLYHDSSSCSDFDQLANAKPNASDGDIVRWYQRFRAQRAEAAAVPRARSRYVRRTAVALDVLGSPDSRALYDFAGTNFLNFTGFQIMGYQSGITIQTLKRMVGTLPNDMEHSGRMLVCPVQFDIVDFLTSAGRTVTIVRLAKCECPKGKPRSDECLQKRLFEHIIKEKVVLPPGVVEYHRIIGKGLGDAPGWRGAADVIIVEYMKPDRHFKRMGADVLAKVDMWLADVIVWKTIVFKNFDGEKIAISTEEGIQDGHEKRIKDQGLPLLMEPAKRGDFVVTIRHLEVTGGRCCRCGDSCKDVKHIVHMPNFAELPNSGLRRGANFPSKNVNNLIVNAMKFTKKGGISLNLSWELDPKEMLLLEVADAGIGMSNEQKHVIFNRFMQADPSIARFSGGTGFGLALVRRLIEELGRTITFDTELGQGAGFQLRLPFESIAFPCPRPFPAGAKHEIIVGTGKDDVDQFLHNIITFYGYKIIYVFGVGQLRKVIRPTVEAVLVDIERSGKEAIPMRNFIKQKYPKLLLCSISSPGMASDFPRALTKPVLPFPLRQLLDDLGITSPRRQPRSVRAWATL